MKKRIFSIVLSMLLCTTSILEINVFANDSIALDGAPSCNISNNNYWFYFGTNVESYLYENADKTLTRVENIDGLVVVENYSANGDKLISTQNIDLELNIFGGFYSGKDYNFLVFGQQNPNESDNTEIMRVVKYSKDWHRLSSGSVYGANTYIPFDAGSLRMTETSGKLYVYTCHEMYQTDDGLHHQANMTFVFDENNLSVVDSYSGIMNIYYGYVSHSFNQFIQTDGEYVYRVDHGDAYPRGISITKCAVNGRITNVDVAIPVLFEGYIGDNYTNATVGGFELSSDNCIIAGSMGDHTSENWAHTAQNIFLSITKKDLSSTNDIVWLTDYDSSAETDVGTPQLVKIGNDRFLLMWEEYNTSTYSACIKMVTVDSNGNKTSKIVSSKLWLSDCQPIKCSDGLVRWYYTSDEKPNLCVIDPFDLESITSFTTYGDADGNGAINMLDVLLIRKYIAKQPVALDTIVADVNCDNAVNMLDALLIRKFIAKQPVTLGPQK